ncbi:SRPBCC family protein [Aliinostoc sp. HNIBRCY26]|uniref:SRPBCC family protein n=1 Tax=Aliinostoc sp. HNIBRCY26 TaxID=3418997 RepID=UPI003D080809
MSLPTTINMKFSHTVETIAPSDRIWNIWTDVKNWPTWDTELEFASLDGNFALNAQGKLKSKNAPVSTFLISQWEPQKSYTFTTVLPLCQLNVRRYLTQNQGKTYFTHEVSFTGLLSFVFSNLLGRKFQTVLPKVMDNIRRLAESSN